MLLGTWDLDASGIGTTLGDLVVRHYQDGPLDGYLGISPVGRMIHAGNLDSWRPWTDRIDVPPLHRRHSTADGAAHMRVLYVNAMDYGANAGVDAIAHGLSHRLAQADIEMRIIYADFRDEGWAETAGRGGAWPASTAGVDAIVVYVLDADAPGRCRRRGAGPKGIPVFTIERPHFPVDGCVVFPNFNHGVYMAEHLATLRAGRRRPSA